MCMCKILPLLTIKLNFSSVYENIVEAIRSAKEAVTEAVERVHSAEQKLYPSHGDSVIFNSKQSLNYSKSLQSDAMQKMEQVDHYNKRISHHVKAVETITNTLVNAGNKLNDISLAASTISKHNLRKSISESSHKADDIIDKMKRESQGLTSILKNFSDMKDKLNHLKPATGLKLGNVQDNLTQAFTNIRHAKMDLDDLEIRSRKDSQKFEVWNSSFAKELQELKDSIAQARHAAESVSIDEFGTFFRLRTDVGLDFLLFLSICLSRIMFAGAYCVDGRFFYSRWSMVFIRYFGASSDSSIQSILGLRCKVDTGVVNTLLL